MALKRINKELTDLGRYVNTLLSAATAGLAVYSHDSLRTRGARARRQRNSLALRPRDIWLTLCL